MGEGASGDPCSGEALPGRALQTAMLFLSSLTTLSLQFSLTHSRFFISTWLLSAVLPSHSNPVILHRAFLCSQ